MFPVSEQFKAALRVPHTAVIRVDVWRAGALLESDIKVLGGGVSFDGTGGVRSTLNLTTDTDHWNTLTPAGTELRAYRGIRFIDGSTELVPLGVHVVDTQRMGFDVGGNLTLTAPDRWATVQRARFLTPATTNGNAVTEAIRLTVAAVAVAATNLTTFAVTTSARVWDRDRDAAIIELVKSASAELFFDDSGLIVARNIPTLSKASVWTVDAGESGVLLAADRERSRARTYNTVVVTCESIDGLVPWAPQIAYDNDPASPTYYLGPFGIVPYFFSSPLLLTAAGALAAARSILARVTGMAANLTLTSAVNPALRPGDTINALLPSRLVEHHLIDQVGVPLDVDSVQQIGTRSTRPEGDVP